MADIIDDQAPLTAPSRQRWVWRLAGGAIVVVVLFVASFEVFYAGKVLPGVSANGIYLAGASTADATSRLQAATTSYASAMLPVTYDQTTLHVPLNTLKLSYDNAQAASLAYGYGRTGSFGRRLHEQLRAMLVRSTNFADYTYNDTQLTPYVAQLSAVVSTPVTDATLTFSNNQAQVTPAVDGRRLNLGLLVMDIENRLGATSTMSVVAPVYRLPAAVSTAALTAATPQVDTDLLAPLTLTYGSTSQTVDQVTIARWIKVAATATPNFIDTHDVRDLYPQAPVANLSVDADAITAYISGLAGNVNKDPVNAQLAMINGTLTVTAPSVDGIALDTTGAVANITTALKQPSGDRTVTIAAKTTQAPVRADNLASLGITDQLSEGETYFPGSPAGRLQNVRAGAAKFNGVVLAPGEQFSFGKLLGEVDASTGYVPELVILADHEEDQYGGGLCQVSSTAFRAALAAGLPINERINHAFAISYYTWPYSVPGIDATIYYPAVDFKFTNDTGHYLLMQTTMKGYDLKFDYYGTKTKSGVIRGPYFVSGSNDATKPSQTVFYRDVLDLAGNVTKTDTFNTYYKSSLLYPVELNGSK